MILFTDEVCTYWSVVLRLPFPLNTEKIIHEVYELLVTAPLLRIGQSKDFVRSALPPHLLHTEVFGLTLHTVDDA